MANKFDVPLCGNCSSTNLKKIAVLESSICVYECKSCHIALTYPPPVTVYDERFDFCEHYLDNEELFRSFFVPVVDFILSHVRGGKLLDIGSSVGFLLEEAVAHGFDVTGLELNKKSVQYCLTESLNVFNKTLLEAHFADAQFDVITMSHVLEHVENIEPFLTEIYRVLNNSGVLVLSQPDYTGFVPRMLKRKWYGWSPRDHFWHFSKQNIRHLLAQNGFEVKKIKTNSLHYNTDGNIRSIIVAIAAKLSGFLGIGDQIYVLAVKKEM